MFVEKFTRVECDCGQVYSLFNTLDETEVCFCSYCGSEEVHSFDEEVNTED